MKPGMASGPKTGAPVDELLGAAGRTCRRCWDGRLCCRLRRSRSRTLCWSERIRFRLSSSSSCTDWSWTEQVELLFCSGVRYGHVSHGFTRNALSAPLPCEKNAEQVLFHSTLEPNTQVFSKVSCGVLRSFKFRLNFAKQRRNAAVLTLLRTSVLTQTASAQPLCLWPVPTARAKRGSRKQQVRATRTSSRMLKSISSAVSAHSLHKTTAICHKTCVRHAKAVQAPKGHVKLRDPSPAVFLAGRLHLLLHGGRKADDQSDL